MKIRVYKQNEWNTKDVLVIRKTALLVDGAKKDKILLKKEFDNLEEAKEYVLENYSNDFKYAFKLSKIVKEYASSTC